MWCIYTVEYDSAFQKIEIIKSTGKTDRTENNHSAWGNPGPQGQILHALSPLC